MAGLANYPLCVRHLKSRKDVRLRHFFLCNSCTQEWTCEAFDGNKPLHEGERVAGHCLHCNRRLKTIRMRTWFLCDICYRVAGSIGRNHVAERAIIYFWDRHVQTRFPTLELQQNDRSSLRPHRATHKSGVGPLDFLVREKKSRRLVFGIENKTGRSSLREMSQFQLDVSDCDSILNDMKERQIGAYLMHAQVLEIWEPPTVGFRIAGLWWTDVYRMTKEFKSVAVRRDEMRGAAFFGKKAFEPIETFADSVMGKQDFALVERFQRGGVPKLYRVAKRKA